MRYLTKSRFTTAITCPTKLGYLDDQRFANADTDNEFLKALANGGHQVGALAKCLFPDGIEIDAAGHDAQVDQTSALLKRDDVVIFEAAVRVGRLFVRVDLLRKRGATIELYEVKAKGFDSRVGEAQIVGKRGGIASEFKPYLYDVAFQRHVLRKAFPEATIVSYLVMPDQAVACPESQLAQRLRIQPSGHRNVKIHVDASLRDGQLARQILYTLPVDVYLDLLVKQPLEAGGYTWAFDEGIAALEAHIDGPAFAPRVGPQCKSCQFRATPSEIREGLQDGRITCWSTQFHLPAEAFVRGTVFDLSNFRGAQGVVESGKILLQDLETEDVKYKSEAGKISQSHRQWLQCEESRRVVDRPVVIAGTLAATLANLTYPLHFIDFETATPALPFHMGHRPYEQLLFQFSHHRIDHTGEMAHVSQHLDSRPGVFPNFDTVRALSRVLGDDDGSVIHWWTHERTVLKAVRTQLLAATDAPGDRDQLIAFIDSLVGADGSTGRLVDLGQHVTHPLLFLPGTKGSSSIKKVLPALLTHSKRLQENYRQPIYGAKGGIASLNFRDQTWVQFDDEGNVLDPYSLLPGRFNDPELDALEDTEESRAVVADGGAAMVAYSLLQSDSLAPKDRAELEKQLFRYCELDTLAMVMAFDGLKEQVGLT
jgi:hypothetical protein